MTLGAATRKTAAKLVACDEGPRPRFGMASQRMVGLYAYSYVTYSDYHRLAHLHHFAFQWHDALFAGRSRTAQQHLTQQHRARRQAIPLQSLPESKRNSKGPSLFN